jgi:hypothetical protein
MIADENEWEIEIAFYANKRGIDPEKARILTILRWMYHGDFRPLAAAIWEGHVLDEAVLNSLAQMIDEDRLKLAPKGRGRPKAPAASVRTIVAALAYDVSDRPTSDEKFANIAKRLGMSEQSVRHAVTAFRRAKPPSA